MQMRRIDKIKKKEILSSCQLGFDKIFIYIYKLTPKKGVGLFICRLKYLNGAPVSYRIFNRLSFK